MPRAVSLIFLLFSLALIAFFVFFNAINHPFVHDDVVFIVQNPQIGHLDHLLNLFFQSSNPQRVAGVNSYYRPVLEIFYRLEYRLFGFHAAGFHFINILIHVLNGLLLCIVLCRLQFSQWLAYSISLLFLIHPIQSEAVACVSGISNLLTAFFILLTLYYYIRGRYVLTFVGLVLALFTKEQAIILVPLLVLIDWYQQKKDRGGLWFVFSIVTLVFLWLRSSITGAHLLEDVLQSPVELKLRLLSIPRTILMYLRLIVFPYDLHYYRNTDILAPNGPAFIMLGALSVALIWLVKKLQMNSREIIFGVTWFVISLLPVLNIIPIINEYSFILTAEHFLYLPMVGVVIVLALIIKRLVSFQVLVAIEIFICLGLGLQTVYQNTFWRGEIPLFQRTVALEKDFARGHMLLAKAYFFNKQEDMAIAQYNQALTIMKGYEKKAVNDKARQFYKSFIKEIYADMAQCFIVKGRFDKAIDALNCTLVIDPKNVGLLNNLAICYIQQGDKAQAEQILKMALGLDPTYIPARNNLKQLMKEN